MRVLMVEDDDLFGSAVQKGLRRLGFAVDWIKVGREVDAAMASWPYESVLLDLGLPDIAGEALIASIRARRPNIPIVVMTARNSVHDRVGILDIGADDYMVKPVDFDEVGARVRAVVRRSQAPREAAAELEFGGLKLFPSTRKAQWQGEEVLLTSKEFSLLETFMRRKGQILTRAQLETTLYAWGEETSSNTVEVYIHFLRRKFFPGLIQTVRGVGYQLAMSPVFDC